MKLAAQEYHGLLVAEFEKASEYHDAARDLASAVTTHNPKFTDKEKINLEIYADGRLIHRSVRGFWIWLAGTAEGLRSTKA